MTKSLAGMILSLLLGASLAAGVLASNDSPDNTSTLSKFLSGAHELTPPGFEAGDTITFISAPAGDVLCTNKNLVAELSTGWKAPDLGRGLLGMMGLKRARKNAA